MQSPLVKGIGPQDHALIGKAASLPGKALGAFISVAPVVLVSAGRLVDLNVRVTAPLSGKSHPLLLLSHGAGPSNNLSSMNGYLPTAQYFASHGFVVVQPTHLTSRSLALPADAPGGPAFERSRVDDMKAILDQLDTVEAAVPGLVGRVDRERVAIFGHSMGTHTAAALLGQRWVDPETSEEVDAYEPRVKAGLLLGAIGRGEVVNDSIRNHYRFMRDSRFQYMQTPTLVVAGDKDDSTHLTPTGYMWHADPYHLAPGPKDLLMLRGANHSFGGISGWDSTDCALYKEESPEMCAVVLRMTLAYLRSRLYDGDASWKEACDALGEIGFGTVESK